MADEEVLAQGVRKKMEWLADRGQVYVTSHEELDEDGVKHRYWSVRWEDSYDENLSRVRYTLEDSLEKTLNKAIEGLL